MFDMGFEPQITKIIQNTRPDRQTVMFSATFPTHVEGLARRALSKPLEIVVGGKTKAAAEIEQIVEVPSLLGVCSCTFLLDCAHRYLIPLTDFVRRLLPAFVTCRFERRTRSGSVCCNY